MHENDPPPAFTTFIRAQGYGSSIPPIEEYTSCPPLPVSLSKHGIEASTVPAGVDSGIDVTFMYLAHHCNDNDNGR